MRPYAPLETDSEPHDPRDPLVSWKDDFPQWLLPVEVKRLAETFEKEKEKVPFRFAAGPAAPWMFLAALLAVGVQAGIFVTALREASCDHEGNVNYPIEIWCYLLVFIVPRMIIEIHCLRFTLIAFYQEVGRFSVWSVNTGFWIWLAYHMVLSLLDMVDLTTDALFAATTITARSCSEGKLEKVWRQVLEQSVFGSLGIHVDLYLIALVVWFLTFAQVILPVLESLPRCADLCKVEWVVVAGDKARAETKYTTISGSETTIGDIVHTMPEAVGMASLIAQATEYPNQKEINTRRDPARSLFFLKVTAARVETRVIYKLCLENALQLNLQVSVLGISLAGVDSWSMAQKQVFGSIVLSLLMAVVKLKESMTALSMYSRVLRKIDSNFSPEVLDDEVKQELSRVSTMRLRILLWTFVYIVGLVYAVAKLVAVFYCEDSLLNVTGCVKLE